MAIFGRKKRAEAQESAPSARPELPAPPPDVAGVRGLESQRDYLLSLVSSLNPMGLRLLDAWDQTLSEDIAALVNVPRRPTATTSGYAVAAADIPDQQTIALPVGEPAPDAPTVARPVRAGEAMPPGADTVIADAQARRDGDTLLVDGPLRVGRHVRPVGADIGVGVRLMACGDRVSARQIGLLACAGIDKVLVRPKPRVVVASVGAELVEPGLALGDEGLVPDTDSYAVAAAARAAGAQVWRVGDLPTDPARLAEALSDQLIRADLMLITPGVAPGDEQAARAAMDRLGGCDHAEIALSPGGRVGFGLIGDDQAPALLLESGAVGALAGFQAFALPLIRKLMGVLPHTPPTIRAIVNKMLRPVPGRTSLVPGRIRTEHGVRHIELIEYEHPLTRLAFSNALIVLPEGHEAVHAGESVVCWPLDPDR